MPRSNDSKLSKSSIAFKSEIPGLIQYFALSFPDTWLYQYSFIYTAITNFLFNCDYPATDISSLYSGKLNRVSRPTSIVTV